MSRYAFAAAVLFFTALAPAAGAGEDTPSPTAALDGMSCAQLAEESQRIETAQRLVDGDMLLGLRGLKQRQLKAHGFIRH